jgi:gliding motility-associated-like protein
MNRKILLTLRVALLCLASLVAWSTGSFAQNFSFTNGNLSVDVTVLNPCSGNNGAIRFTINSTEGSANASIAVFGPVNLFPPQSVAPGGTFTFNAPMTLPAGTYNWIVGDGTNSVGSLSPSADPAFVLTNISSPSIVKDMEVNNTSCANPNGQVQGTINGGSETLAGGGSYTYTWTSDNSLAGLPLVGQSNGIAPLNLATLLGIPGLRAGNYTLVVQDNFAQCSATTVFTITDPSPATFALTTGSPLVVCTGTPITLSLSNSENAPVTYEIIRNAAPTGITFPGDGSSPFVMNFSSATFADGDVLQVRATNGFCTPVMMTGSVILDIVPLPVPTLTGGNLFCEGTTGVIYSTEAGQSNYSWVVSAGGTITSGGGINDPTVTVTWSSPGAQSVSVNYQDINGCSAVAPTSIAVTVNPLPVLVTPQAKTVCTGDNVAYEILLTPANTPAGTVFNWADPDGAGPATAGVNVPMGAAGTTHINDVLTNATSAPITVTYQVTPTSGAGCVGVTRNVVITVSPRPVLVTPQTKTICSGQNTAYEILLTPANQPAGTTFSWPDPDGAGPATAGVNVPMGAAGTTHINDVLTNFTGAPTTVTYVITPTTAGCSGTPRNVVITVNPAPVLVTPQTKTICTGDNVAYEILLTPANLPAGTVFNWPDPDGAGPATAGVNVPMGAAGTLHINDVLTNLTTAPITVTYMVTPTSGLGCPGTTQPVVITVNPRPVLVTPQAKTICSGDNTAYEILLNPANLPAGTTFSWPDPDGAGPATAGVNVPMGVAGTTHINDVLVNATSAPTTVTYVVTPSTGTCTGTPVNVVITINPRPVLVTPQAKTICSGSNVAYEILLTPANQPAGTVFNWPDPDGAGPATAGVNVPMGVAGTIHINDILTNATTAPITVTYQVTPTGPSGCPGVQRDVVITVTPTPVLVAGQAKTICSGANTAYEILLNPANLPAGTVFNWPDPDGAGPATAGVNVPMGVAGTTHINNVLTNATGAPITVTYVVTPSVSGCAGTPGNVVITVNPAPVLVFPQNKTICSGDNVAKEILLNPANQPAGTVFNWPDPDGAGPATAGVNVPMGAAGTLHINDVLTNATSAPINVTYVVTPSGPSGCTGVTRNIVITVRPRPVLVTPQAKTICSGSNVAYHILLTPANLPTGTVFNWPDPDGAGPATAGVNVAMGTAATIHINDVLTNATSAPIVVTYQVTPTGPGGCAGTTQNIDITVNPSPVLVTPQTKTICSGSNTAYEILLNPANLPAGTTFSWPDPDGAGPATAGVNVPMGAAGTTHINDVLVNTTGAPIVVNYVVTPSAGGCSGTARTVAITVNPAPVLVTPQAKAICSGSNVAYEILLNPANQPAGTVFNWADPDGAGPATAGVNVPMGAAGTIHINDVLTNATTSPITVTYQITPTSGAGCVGTQQDVVITVNPAPVLVTPQTKTICGGDNVAYEILLNPANQPAGTVFNWPDPDGAGPATAGVNVPMGAAGTTHINDALVNTTSAPITVTYQVTPSSGSGCVGVQRDVVITVNPTPVLVTPQTKTICSGDNVAYEILLNPANLPVGTVFNWADPDGAGPATAGVNVPMGAAGTLHINDVLTNATTSSITVTYVVTATVGSCTSAPVNVDIIVSPAAPVLVTPQAKTICSGENVAYEILLSPLNQPGGTVFNWPDPDGGGPATAGVNVAMGPAGTIHINDVLTNVSSAPITVTYVVTASTGSCAGTPVNVDITVNPTPVLVTPQAKTICSGDNVAYEILLNPANLPLGTLFNWPDPDGAGPATAGVNVPMGVAGTLHINDVLTNATTAPVTVTYVVTPSLGTCVGIPVNVDITVNPVPVLVSPQTKTICSGDNTAYEILLNPANLPVGTVFNWGDPDGAGPATAGVNVPMGAAGTTHINDVLINTTGSPMTVTYIVIPSIGGCAGAPFNVDIIVNPAPVLVTPQAKTICSGDNAAYEILLTPANLPTGTVFNWPDPDGAGPATAGVNVPMGAAGTLHINDVLTNLTAAPITVTYTITPSQGGCVGVAADIDITVTPAIQITSVTLANVTCNSGNDGSIDVVATGGTGALTYTLTPGPVVNGTGSFAGLAANTYTITIADGSGCSADTTVTITEPAQIVGTISGTTSICNGQSTMITVTFTGGSPQWFFRYSETDANGTTVSPEIPSFFNSISFPVTPGLTTTYALVSVRDGSCTGVGAGSAVVTVNNPPDASLAVDAAISPLCNGGVTDITVALSEAGVSYQLRNDADDSPIGAPVIGNGGTITLSTGALTATTTFNVLATATGCASVELTDKATVTVAGSINAGLTVNPLATPVCSGGSTSIRITSSETGVLYQLRDNADDSAIGAPVAGTGGDIDLPTGALTVQTVFNILADNGTCSIELTDIDTVDIDINPNPGLPVSVVLDPLCNGGNTDIQVSNSEVGVTYQLRNDADDSNVGAPVAGTGGTIFLNTGVLTTTTTFNILASGGGACTAVELATTPTVTVSGTIDITLAVTPLSDPVCEGTSTFITITNSEAGVNYQLRDDADDSNIGAPVAGTGGDIDLPTGNLAATTTFNILASNGTCSIQMTNTATVNVSVNPLTNLPVDATINPLCTGGVSGIRIQNSQTGVIYQLRNDADDSAVGAPVAGTGGTIILSTGVLNATTTFNVLASSGGTCPDAELTTIITITVGGTINNALNTDPSPTTPICAGSGAFVVVQASEAGVNYQLRNDADDSNVGAPVAGTGADINLPTGNLAATTTFNVLASNGVCSIELTDTETITVNPAPSTTLAVTANPSVICPGNPSIVQVAGSEAGVSYQLRNNADNSNVGTAVAGTGGTILLPTGALATTTTFNVLASAGTCSAQLTTTATVTVRLPGDPACGGTGDCATVVIRPQPKPATCTNSDGKITFFIIPFVPAVNVTGVKIEIQGISPTNTTISRTQFNDSVFTALPAGIYDYTITYGDVSCIKTGQVTIDQSGTVGTPVASNIINPTCAGSASGALTLDVPGETGNLLEFSLDGLSWTPFTAGSQITGIPSGPSPTFERVISVRRNSSDPCNAFVRIVMQDVNPAITATFDIDPSTCSGSDGSITNIVAGGGSGSGYEFSINGVDFQSEAEFLNLGGGGYTLTVRDGAGCIQTFPANVTFPGFIDFSVVATDPVSCTVLGELAISFDNAGTYEVGISFDPGVEPEAYEPPYVSSGAGDLPKVISNLSGGDYYVFVKTSSVECPTRKGPFTIFGPKAIDFDIAAECISNVLVLRLTDIQGEAGNVDIAVLNELLLPVDQYTETLVPGGSILINSEFHPFLTDPGRYIIRLTQTDICEIVHEETIDVPAPLFAAVEGIKESYPDLMTGAFEVVNFSGGIIPYQIRIELDQAAVGGQSFETDFEEVPKNSNLDYQMSYSKIPAGNYIIQIVDSIGCSLELTTLVPLDTDIYVPNIFTPNDDGHNDVFFVRNLPEGGVKLTVSNRWGKQVYSSGAYQNNWDADGVEDGIYFYQLKPEGGEPLTGWVEVLRGVKP